MSAPFRLERLLRIREDEARAQKLRWAERARARGNADAEHRAALARIAQARREIAELRATAGARPARLAALSHAEDVTLDALGAAEAQAVDAAQAAAEAEATERQAYEAANQRLRAIELLEEKWRRAEQKRRRRRENMQLDEIVGTRAIAAGRANVAEEADDRR